MISFQQVIKNFGTQQILASASFTINSGARVGIVGANGAGKSTIFQLLIGALEVDKGDISFPASMRIGYVRQQLKPHLVKRSLLAYVSDAIVELKVIEEKIDAIEHQLHLDGQGDNERLLTRLGELQSKYEQLGGYDLEPRAKAALSGLGFAVDRFEDPFTSFSGGWQIRAELARTLISQPDILLLDEPTNYLDVPAVEWLQEFLYSYSGTLLLISHDRYLLNKLTTSTLEVAGGKVTEYVGNYDQYINCRKERYNQLLAAQKNQDRKREQIERFVERFRSKNTKASQVQSRLKMLEKLEDISLPEEVTSPPHITLPPPPHCGNEIIRFVDVNFAYPDSEPIFRDICLRIEKGEKIAILGLNGMGKTTLLKLIVGKLQANSGEIVLGHKVSIGYQPQDFTDVMDPDKSVYDTARATAKTRTDKEVRSLLGSFRFSGDSIEKRVSVLSGGEKVRLGLARLLLQPCNFLVLDEPTTHLDIGTREALEQALRDYPGTLCLVSHDIEFVRHIAKTIFAVTADGIVRYYGDYDYYRDKIVDIEVDDVVNEVVVATKSQNRKEQKRLEAQLRQEFYKQRKPLEKLVTKAEDLLECLELEQGEILAEMNKPTCNHADLNIRLAKIQKGLEDATEQWESTSLKLEELQENYKEQVKGLKI